jgi:arylsulfatase A-like enzyme
MPRDVLFFMTDQQRAETILPGHRLKAKTPHVDRLRERGTSFTNAWCPSPHCCPSRASFFTGLFPSQHGVWNNINVANALSHGPRDGVTCWSEPVAAAGYQMPFAGKWHVEMPEDPGTRGWDVAYGKQEPGPFDKAAVRQKAIDLAKTFAAEPPTKTPGDGLIPRPGYWNHVHFRTRDNPFNDGTVVDHAVEAIASLDPDRPFCGYVGTLGPHDPYIPPAEFLEQYDLADIELPENFDDDLTDRPGLYRRTRDKFGTLSRDEHREAIRHYLAFCTYEDHLFGRVLEAMDQAGRLDDAVVVYVSDHGDYVGEHGLWTKGLPCFDGAYRIPMVIADPHRPAGHGRTVDAFVTLQDLAPTVCELTGVDVPRPDPEVRSLLPWLDGQTPGDWRDAIFLQSNGNETYGIQRAVVTDDWKFVYNGFDYDELYDRRNDPLELRNLARDEGHRDVVRAMYRRLWDFGLTHEEEIFNPYIMTAMADYGPGISGLATGPARP